MMNILFFISGLGSGGAQRQIVELSIGFKKMGYGVRFLIYQKKWSDYYCEHLHNNGIEIDGIYEDNYIKRIWKIRKYLRSNNFNVVIAFLEAPSFIAELATFPSKKWKLIVGERSADPAKQTSLKLRSFLRFHVLADYVVANSQANIDIIQKIAPIVPKKKCKVIYNMYDVDNLKPAKNYKFYAQERFHLIIASSHRFLKNLNGLIEGVNLLSEDDRSKIKISWYGNSKFDSSLDEGKQKIIHYGLEDVFSFHDPTLNIYDHMRNADAVGLFSFFEGLPNAICEGMLLGKPIIVSKVSDIPLLFEKGAKGFLCEADKPKTIADALSKILHCTPDELDSMGRDNHILASKLFNEKEILESYKSLF